MSTSLERLPFDVVHHVASLLDVHSFDSLGKTTQSLDDHLRDENTAKNALKNSVPHNLWVQLALSPPQASLRQTLGRINDCHVALQEAAPYSACILAQASSFVYHSGLLCYTSRGNLRILDFNDQRGTEKIFNGNVLVNHITVPQQEHGLLDPNALKSLQVLGIADDITVVHGDFGSLGQYVFAIDIADRPSSSPGAGLQARVRLCTPARSSKKLFTKHNRNFLVMGSHSATGTHAHREWLMQVFSLDASKPVNTEPLQLRGFHGSDIGSTVCFTIHKGYFYAVTNQTSLESEEVDWTSYYHVVKLRLGDQHPELPIKTIWRRQHLEGPINDLWTDLGFQVDQCTGELLIVECRKEWVKGGSQSVRTYYSQPVNRAKLKDQGDGMRHPPTRDCLISTLDESSNSQYEEPNVRIARYVHAEFSVVGTENVKEYTRTKTKWNGYNFNAQCFVDLAIDEFVLEGERRPQQRVRLRVVSRKELCPLIRDGMATSPAALKIRPRIRDHEDQEMEDGERTFSPSQVYLWPPENAPRELSDILCPGGRVEDVRVMLGDEGIIYMAGPPESDTSERPMVFICCDPTFGFTGMKRLDGTCAIPKGKTRRKRDLPGDVWQAERRENQLSHATEAEPVKRPKLQTGADNPCADLSASGPADVVFSTVCSESRPPTIDPDAMSPTHSLGTSQCPPAGSQSCDFATSTFSRPCDRGGGKGRARAPVRTGEMWREKAAYLAISQGYWLRGSTSKLTHAMNVD